MEITDVITEDNNIRELDTVNANTNICSILPVDSSISSTSSTESNSSDSMETDSSPPSGTCSTSVSDDDSTDSMRESDSMSSFLVFSDYIPSDGSSGITGDESDDSMSLSSESSQSDRDSSSDYCPSESSMEISSSESEPETKKRKRNPLNNFCLYSIKPNNPNDTNLYIGSTVNFNRRKQQHKKAVTNKRGGTYYCILYRYIRKCGGWDNFTMEKILDYPCETKQQGLLKEKEYIISHKATLNSVMPVSDFTERMNDI